MNEVSLSHADCIRTQTNWGETVVWNICADTQSAVPWGTMDYLGAAGLTAFLALFGLVGLALLVVIIRD